MNKTIIGIDARFYGPVGKGLGRYTQEIVDRILQLDSENDYVIFLCPENYDFFQPPRPGVRKILVKARWYSLREQIELPFLIWRKKINLMHFTHFNVPLVTPAKFIVTIHDLILTKFPTVRASTLSPWFYKIKNFFYKLIILTAVKRARKIIAVSSFTRDDIISYFKIKAEKVVIIYEGVASLNYELRIKNNKLIQNSESKILNSKFLLYVGNAYPHKNLEGLIKIMPELRQEFKNLQLVLVGKEDYFYKRVKDYAQGLDLFQKGREDSPVIFPGYVSDQDLRRLYAQATAYVFPSLYEGFGLPPLEAMSQSCPVISSNKSCLPEILGEAAIYFNPEKEAEMVSQIRRVIGNEEERQNLRQKGLRQVEKYSWQKAAQQTFELYQEIIRL